MDDTAAACLQELVPRFREAVKAGSESHLGLLVAYAASVNNALTKDVLKNAHVFDGDVLIQHIAKSGNEALLNWAIREGLACTDANIVANAVKALQTLKGNDKEFYELKNFVHMLRDKHRLTGKYYSVFHIYLLFIPSLLVSSAAGFLSFISAGGNRENKDGKKAYSRTDLALIIGGLSVTTSLLQTIGDQLQLNAKALQHNAAADELTKVLTDLDSGYSSQVDVKEIREKVHNLGKTCTYQVHSRIGAVFDELVDEMCALRQQAAKKANYIPTVSEAAEAKKMDINAVFSAISADLTFPWYLRLQDIKEAAFKEMQKDTLALLGRSNPKPMYHCSFLLCCFRCLCWRSKPKAKAELVVALREYYSAEFGTKKKTAKGGQSLGDDLEGGGEESDENEDGNGAAGARSRSWCFGDHAFDEKEDEEKEEKEGEEEKKDSNDKGASSSIISRMKSCFCGSSPSEQSSPSTAKNLKLPQGRELHKGSARAARKTRTTGNSSTLGAQPSSLEVPRFNPLAFALMLSAELKVRVGHVKYLSMFHERSDAYYAKPTNKGLYTEDMFALELLEEYKTRSPEEHAQDYFRCLARYNAHSSPATHRGAVEMNLRPEEKLRDPPPPPDPRDMQPKIINEKKAGEESEGHDGPSSPARAVSPAPLPPPALPDRVNAQGDESAHDDLPPPPDPRDTDTTSINDREAGEDPEGDDDAPVTAPSPRSPASAASPAPSAPLPGKVNSDGDDE